MEGYQEQDGVTSLKGTLVPAKTLNKIISKIPIIGNIVIPKEVGEGLFGISFKMKGMPGKIKTTVNPLNPEAATSLATDGVFSVTRNPMYLGMCFILLATSFFSGAWLGLPLILIFMAYITLFQIFPEERAMKDLFGEKFELYKARVRMWI